jgi:hypothetical protein
VIATFGAANYWWTGSLVYAVAPLVALASLMFVGWLLGRLAERPIDMTPSGDRAHADDRRSSRWMENADAITVRMSAAEVRRAVCLTAEDLSRSQVLTHSDSLIEICVGFSWRSWGEIVRVEIISGENETLVKVVSTPKLSTTVIDWGANKRNVEKVISALRQTDHGQQ